LLRCMSLLRPNSDPRRCPRLRRCWGLSRHDDTVNLGLPPSASRRSRLCVRPREPYTFSQRVCGKMASIKLPATTMPRPRSRVCLQDGLKLDLNYLARKGFIKFGANIGARGISWSNAHRGEIASDVIAADMTEPSHAWFRVAMGGFAQQITLVSRPRHHLALASICSAAVDKISGAARSGAHHAVGTFSDRGLLRAAAETRSERRCLAGT
jgi:hypothetical protein